MSGYGVSRVLAACGLWLTLGVSVPIFAQQRDLTLDEIFDPQHLVDFDGSLPQIVTWIDDERYLERDTRSPGPLLTVTASTGARAPLLDADAMEEALAGLPDLSRDDARRLSRGDTHRVNRSQTALVVDHDDDLYYYDFGTDEASRLTRSPEPESEVSFSPNGAFVAFVRDHDLHVVDISHRREYALTADGSAKVRNGLLDWVYQEEIYGRGDFKGYWWSPDSTQVAYLQLNDIEVPEFTIVDHIAYHPEVETWDYPKAGDPNPEVRLGVVPALGGDTTWIDLARYAPSQPLVVSVGWSPNGREVVFQIQDREQTWLDLDIASPGGETTRVLRETTEAWVNVNGPPTWLEDGSFLWLSERTGWRHLYHLRRDGTVVSQVTDGLWEVRELHGVDEDAGWVYFSGTQRSPIGSDVYRVRLDGSGLTRLSAADGTHRARFNPSLTSYLDTWSDIETPPSRRLHAADGSQTRVIDANDTTSLGQYRLSAPELLQVVNRDGFEMEALMIKPPDFDPSRRYPVYQHVYGGPHVQRVRDAWGGSTYLFWQLLAQQGVIVWVLDNSTASGKGAVSTWPVYKNFGALELRDLEDGIAWLGQQTYVDTDRIGIEGWSYGGFMVSYALTHSRSYAMGIAGGSVTDWRDYDTIYTERYMGMPQDNPDGYRQSSPRFAARNLHGELLLIHGAMDENVHMQNTLQFAYELQRAGKRFDMMVYPKSRHRLAEPELEKHRHIKMLDFVRQHLSPRSTATAPTSAQH